MKFRECKCFHGLDVEGWTIVSRAERFENGKPTGELECTLMCNHHLPLALEAPKAECRCCKNDWRIVVDKNGKKRSIYKMTPCELEKHIREIQKNIKEGKLK